MKSIKLLVAAALAATAFGAQAADTNTLTINGTITPVCKFNLPAGAETLALTMDATVATNATAAATIQYWCTKGTTAVFAPNNGLNFAGATRNLKQAAAPNGVIPYALTVVGAGVVGAGKTTLQNSTATVTVLNANYVNADATSVYTDQVVITLTP